MQPPGDITSWVYKAEEDYRTAITMVRKRKEVAPDNVCFCAQQCVEKYVRNRVFAKNSVSSTTSERRIKNGKISD